MRNRYSVLVAVVSALGCVGTSEPEITLSAALMIEVGKYTPTTKGARVSRWQNGVFIAAAHGTIRNITNGYEAAVPADACDDDGPALLKVDAFRQLGTNSYSTRQDWAPDPGQPAVPLR